MGQSSRSVSYGGLRVLIAGGGVAGLEVMLALRDLAGELVDVELLSPEPWFWYRPISVAEPFDPSRAYRFELSALAAAAGVSLTTGLLVGVNVEAHRAEVSNGREIAYDVLVITAGTRATVALEGALTFRGPADVEAFRTILTEVEAGLTKRIAFTLPRRAGWPLPLYELALLTAAHVQEHVVDGVELSLVTHEQAPLGLLGDQASDAIRGLLEQAGITLHTGCSPLSVEPGRLTLAPAGSLAVDRVVALARLEGEPIEGVPHDRDGFIATDRQGRVEELADVYAAGDITRFPIKQGGIATQQADVVAEHLAARAGAKLTPKPHQPVLRALLLTGSQPLYLEAELATDFGYRSTVSTEPLWWPPAKIAGRHLAPFLASQSLDALGE
jgi:sulfide:quinone oxidoreductase